MAKGKSSGVKYVSSGVHSSVSSKITKAARAEYLQSGERIMNQLKAHRARKRVMLTIENPDKNDRARPFIRVPASQVWK